MSQPANVWIIDDDRSIRWVLERALSQAGMQPRVFDSGDSIMMRLEHEQPDASSAISGCLAWMESPCSPRS